MFSLQWACWEELSPERSLSPIPTRLSGLPWCCPLRGWPWPFARTSCAVPVAVALPGRSWHRLLSGAWQPPFLRHLWDELSPQVQLEPCPAQQGAAPRGWRWPGWRDTLRKWGGSTRWPVMGSWSCSYHLFAENINCFLSKLLEASHASLEHCVQRSCMF